MRSWPGAAPPDRVPRQPHRHHEPFLVLGLLPCLARLDPLRLALLLGKVRRPRRIAQPLRLVFRGEIEEWLEREGPVVDAGADVPELREARRDRGDGQITRL